MEKNYLSIIVFNTIHASFAQIKIPATYSQLNVNNIQLKGICSIINKNNIVDVITFYLGSIIVEKLLAFHQ